jgi:hypothetical protein
MRILFVSGAFLPEFSESYAEFIRLLRTVAYVKEIYLSADINLRNIALKIRHMRIKYKLDLLCVYSSACMLLPFLREFWLRCVIINPVILTHHHLPMLDLLSYVPRICAEYILKGLFGDAVLLETHTWSYTIEHLRQYVASLIAQTCNGTSLDDCETRRRALYIVGRRDFLANQTMRGLNIAPVNIVYIDCMHIPNHREQEHIVSLISRYSQAEHRSQPVTQHTPFNTPP